MTAARRQVVFNHVPKTAGSALSAALVEALAPERLVTGTDVWFAAEFGEDDYTRHHDAVEGVDQLPLDADLVSAHITPWMTRARYPDALHLTLVREPRARLLSQWMHCRATPEWSLRHFGRGADAYRAARGSFAAYLQDPRAILYVDNLLTRFLAAPLEPTLARRFLDDDEGERLVEAALESLRRFDFVDVVEDPQRYERLSALLGTKLRPVVTNERRGVPYRSRVDINREMDAEARRLLDRRTRLDRRLWDAAATSSIGGDTVALADRTWRDTLDRHQRAAGRGTGIPTPRMIFYAAYEVLAARRARASTTEGADRSLRH